MLSLWLAVLPGVFFADSCRVWFGVNTAPQHESLRTAIRETWMRHPWVLKHGQVFFVIGKSGNASVDAAVDQEDKEHADILHVNMWEEYKNLPLKTLLLLRAGVKSGADYVIKIDDDVVPRMDSLIQVFSGLQPSTGEILRYVGRFWESWETHVSRDPKDEKYYVPSDVWPYEKFPKFANGPLYMLSRDLAATVSMNDFKENSHNPIPLEDVNIGAAVSQVVKSGRKVEYVDLTLGRKAGRGVLVYGCQHGVWSHYYHGISAYCMPCMWRKLEARADDVCCTDLEAAIDAATAQNVSSLHSAGAPQIQAILPKPGFHGFLRRHRFP